MSAKSIFIEGGEIGSLMRSLDWSQTPLGDVADWPQSLRSAISILLPSKAQICLFWGPELIALYNDAYSPAIGSKHPRSLGRPAREVWSEIWDVLEPLLKGVVATGEAFWAQDALFFLNRHGYLEETYFDVSYDPVRDESGSVGGVFCIVNETTGRVLGDRRLQTLSLLTSETARSKTVETACLAAIQALATNSHDIPFAMLYRVDADGKQASLIETTGIDAETSATPAKVDLTRECDGWGFRRIYETGEAAIVDDLAARFGALPGGVWDKPPSAAWVVPLRMAGQKQIVGLMVLGINPYRAFEQEYRKFFDLVVGNVTTAIANARAYEEERKRMEALAELDRAKTTFFNNVSHEFRTPLTLMLSPLEETLTEFEGVLPPKVRSQLEMVQRNGMRLLKLVNTLLDFSRIEAGRTLASYEPTDLATYTAELASIFRSAIEQAGLQLIVDCPPLPEPVYVDREMWEKIVLNLLSNAFKFTFEGEIAVSLRPIDNRVELVVRDTGTGISADEIPRVFERFHRVEGAKGRTFEGTGIGLSLVRELVHLHSGAIAVDSTLGQGSTFTVQLPTGTAHLPCDRLNANQSGVSTTSRAISYVEEALSWLPEDNAELSLQDGENYQFSTDSARILLVDDNTDMRNYLRRILGQYYKVDVALDGETALAAAYNYSPDLILSDVMMPGMDGFELLRRLRADSRTRELPILLLSARAGEESAVEGLETGADDYLVKPFSRRELLARVAANLELGRSRSESARRQIQLYADVVRNTQVGIVVWQLEDSNNPGSFRLLIANPAASEITGVNLEPLIGTTMAESFSTLLKTPLVQHYVTVVQTGQSLDLGEVSYSDDGITAGIYTLKAFALPDRCLGLAFENITARKQVEAQLKESLHYSQQIVGAMPGILFVYDLVERQTIYTSPQITDLLGYTSEQLEAMGSNLFARIIYADDIPHLVAYLEGFWAAPDGTVRGLEYRVHHANGECRWMYSQSVVFNRTAQGVPRQILGISIDVSDRKQAELVLVEQNRLLELTAAGHPLDECLSSVCYSVSKLNPGVQACILLSDAQRLMFKHSITPSFPPSFAAGLKNAPINELAIGTCGTAVYCGKPVTCADIANDDRWSLEWRNLCLSHGILACYSAPILGADDLPLGSLMLCFKEARLPTAWEHQLAEFGTHIASIIFERDRSSLALRESEEKYRTLTELSTHHVWMLDTTGELVFLNQSFSDFFGKTLDELKRANWAKNAHHPDDHDRVVQTIAGAMATGTNIRSEHRIRRHDNQFRWFLHEAIPLRDASGEIAHWLGASVDIDDIKQAEAALRRSEERYRMLFESIDEGFCVIEVLFDENETPIDYRFLEVNPAFEKQTGLQQATGKTARQLVPNLEDYWIETYGKIALMGESRRFESCSKVMNRWFDVYAFPIGQPEDRKIALLFNEISDRISHEAEREQLLQREKTAREAAENANRIKDEFLAVLSHELRSPLNPILGWTSLLRNGRLDAAKTAHAVEIIDRNAKLQVQLIDDLLDTSRILSGKLSLNVASVDLGAVIRAALETVRLAAEAKFLQIKTIISPAIGRINGDAGRLQQVLWNLLSNAVKFTPQGGQITVVLTQAETHALIQVTDTGKGIIPEFLPYVFEHFRQEDGATTRKFGGLGLGLAIVRHLVEQHGGTVQADSAGEGQGATFSVKLPLLKNENRRLRDEQISASITSPTLLLSNVRVLVVDDDEDTRELIVFILEQAGAIVTAVSSAIAVKEVLDRGKPDVLISDIGMPEMDGYMLMKQIRTTLQDNRISAIALTAYAGEGDRQQALAAGFQRHLSKPIEPEMLVQAVVSLIERGNIADN